MGFQIRSGKAAHASGRGCEPISSELMARLLAELASELPTATPEPRTDSGPEPAALHALLGRYVGLLLHWNQAVNLTGARDPELLVRGHFGDALALARVLPTGGRVMDVGAGGGLPALPLACLRPELAFLLVEPRARRAAFLRTAIRELGLGSRCQVSEARLADPPDPGLCAAFDGALSKATFEPPTWLRLGASLVRPGGWIGVLGTAAIAQAQVPPGLFLRHRLDYQALEHRRTLSVFERST